MNNFYALAVKELKATGAWPVVAAGGTEVITKPINNLISLLLVVVAAVGVIIIIKGIMEFAIAWNQTDSAGMASGIKQFIAGLLMASIGTVLVFLGISTSV